MQNADLLNQNLGQLSLLCTTGLEISYWLSLVWMTGVAVPQQSVSMGNASQHHQQMLGVAVEINAPFNTIYVIS